MLLPFFRLFLYLFYCLVYLSIQTATAIPVARWRGGGVAALEFEYKYYDWQLVRSQFTLVPTEESLPALVLKDKRVYEYVYDNQQQVHLLETVHKIFKINSLEALEVLNKVYLPAQEIEHVWVLKARCINPNGTIIELPNEAIKDIETWEQNGKEKIFAMEGAEVGCEIEYLYTIEKSLKYFGSAVFQSIFFTKQLDFELISPKKLVFHAQIYNKLSSLQNEVTKYANKNTLALHLDSMEGLPAEPFALHEANLMRIDYKLAYHDTPAHRMFTWDDAAKYFYDQLYGHRDNSLLATEPIKLFMRELLATCKTDAEKILVIETYLKTHFQYVPTLPNTSVQVVWKRKTASLQDFLQLFTLCLDIANIPHQLVLTTNRTQSDWTADFENWSYLEKYLFYFPHLALYVSPLDAAYRLGEIPYYYHHQKGVFIDKQKWGGVLYTQVKDIVAPLPTAETVRLLVALQPDTKNYMVSFQQTFTGHYATLLQHHYTTASTSQQRHLVNELVLPFKTPEQPLQLLQVVAQTQKFALCGDLEDNKLLGFAGRHLLLQVGKLLRNNYEPLLLHQQRKQPVDFDFPRTQTYYIQFEIPQGFIVRNLEDLNKHCSYRNAHGEGLSFQSQYELEGNTVTITISEQLNVRRIPTEEYATFYKVIEEIEHFRHLCLVLNRL